jgi:hypothetical protein
VGGIPVTVVVVVVESLLIFVVVMVLLSWFKRPSPSMSVPGRLVVSVRVSVCVSVIVSVSVSVDVSMDVSADVSVVWCVVRSLVLKMVKSLNISFAVFIASSLIFLFSSSSLLFSLVRYCLPPLFLDIVDLLESPFADSLFVIVRWKS